MSRIYMGTWESLVKGKLLRLETFPKKNPTVLTSVSISLKQEVLVLQAQFAVSIETWKNHFRFSLISETNSYWVNSAPFPRLVKDI